MRCLDGITDSMDMGLGKLWEFDGQEGLACCSSWGRRESDMTARLHCTDGVYVSVPGHVSVSLCPPGIFLLWHQPCWISDKVASVQFSSAAQSCLTLCNPMDCLMPGLPVQHQLSAGVYSNSCPLSQ